MYLQGMSRARVKELSKHPPSETLKIKKKTQNPKQQKTPN